MRCQACGADVVEQAVYCHKCGERVAPDHSFDPPGVGDPVGKRLPAAGADEPTAVASDTAADRVRASATAHLRGEEGDEKELWKGGYSSKAMIEAWFLTAMVTIGSVAVWIWWRPQNAGWWLVLLAGLALLWLYQLLVLAYRRVNVRYLLTTQRFLFEKGILRRVTDCIEVIDISDITFEQGILERLAGVGTIRIASTDHSAPQVVMTGIENVKEVSRTIDEVRRAERRRRGLHIEQI